MNDVAVRFVTRADRELRNDRVRAAVRHSTSLLAANRSTALDGLADPDAVRDSAHAIRRRAIDTLPQMPDARLLEGNFMTVNHGLGTPRAGRTGAGADYLKAFVDEMVASGFIARSIEKNGVKGLAAVAPKKP